MAGAIMTLLKLFLAWLAVFAASLIILTLSFACFIMGESSACEAINPAFYSVGCLVLAWFVYAYTVIKNEVLA